MPYFICKIPDSKTVEILDKFTSYREAREDVRKRRKATPEGREIYRMVFAANPIEAEKLLLTPREAPVQGDD